MPIYRKIYERHHGPIPIDPNGRTYDIHHIDGDHSNNHISNLKAVTLQEHYDIHYAQADWGACTLIAKRSSLPPEYFAEVGAKSSRQRIADGTHHFLNNNPMVGRPQPQKFQKGYIPHNKISTTFLFTCKQCEQTFERPDKKYYRKRSFCGKGCAQTHHNLNR